MFRSRVSNLALVTQNFQWMLLMGTSMLVASHLQVVRQYDAIETGVIFSAATFGILVSSLAAGALVRRFEQRSMIIVGFAVTGSACCSCCWWALFRGRGLSLPDSWPSGWALASCSPRA